MMKKYSSFKKTNFSLLEAIPNNWSLQKIKFVAQIFNGDSLNDDFKAMFESENPDQLAYVSSKDIDVDTSEVQYENGLRIPRDYPKLKIAPANTTLLCIEGGSAGRKLAFTNQDVYFVNKLACFNVSNSTTSKYLYYSLRSDIFQNQFNNAITGLIGGVSISNLKNFYLSFPPIEEQSSIVQYLDYQTSIINQLIQQKEKLIELLREKRKAVINEAITKGLDPNAKMKDSGIEWVGEIPEHWDISKVKWHLEFCNNKRVPLEAAERYNRKGPYPYYGASGIIDSVDDFLFEGNFILVGEDGANILSRSTPLAFIATGKFWVNNHAHILNVPKGEIEYFCEQLELNDYSTIATGSAQPKLTKEALGNLKIIVPPKEEQTSIVEHIRNSNKLIDGAVSKILLQIENLKEYRQSIISEAVTGKIDVRDWQPNTKQVA